MSAGPMKVVKHREGLWQWGTPHPAWRGDDDWDPLVWCTYYEAPDATVVIDPLIPGDAGDRERFWRALDADVERRGLPTVVLLTCGWHARSTSAVAARYAARVFAPDGGRRRDGGSALPVVDGDAPVATVLVRDTGAPPPNLEVAYAVGEDVLVTGDLLHMQGGRLQVSPPEWHSENAQTRAWHATQAIPTVRALLDPRPALLLTGHGAATTAQVDALLRSLGPA